MQYADKVLTCVDGERTFVFTAEEQVSFPDNQVVHEPRHCKRCRARRSRWTLWVIVLLLASSLPAWAAVAITTTLTTVSKTVSSHNVTTLTAKVSPTTITQGLVQFYDGKVLLGTGQLVNTGTKHTHGAAYLSVELGVGTHAMTAKFVATAAAAASTSAAVNVTVAGGTSTTMSFLGSAGNYTLISQVVANGLIAPTGTVNFFDLSGGDAQFAAATLGASTLASTFGSAAVYHNFDNTSGAYGAVVADFNGDGFLDIAEIDSSDVVGIRLGKGDGTFQAAYAYCMTTNTAHEPCDLLLSEPASIAVGDFNSDGIPDLAVADEGDIVVLLGKGDGTFLAPSKEYSVGSGGVGLVVAADFNRDGTPDLVIGVSGGISLLLGNGNGSFQPHTDTGVTGPGSDYLAVGDFNHDGLLDLAVTGWNSGSIAVLLGNGDGTFKAEKDTDIDNNPANDGNYPIIAADFKGTGFAGDLAIAGSDVLEVLIGKGDGTFPASGDPAVQTYYPNTTFSETVGGVAVGDFNNDGILDIAMTWYNSDTDDGRVAVFWGKAGGTFNATPKTVNVGQQPVWVAGADFNGDGLLDLVTSNYYDNTLTAVLSSASNTATASMTGAVPGIGLQQVYAKYMGTSALTPSTSSTIALTGNGVAVPLLTSISPATTMAGGAAFTLTVTGSNFVSGDVVKWNSSARTTAFVSATKLTVSIPATDIAAAGTYAVRVTTPGGVNTASLSFTVTPLVVVPAITSISPATASAGGPAFTLTVTGSNFITGSVVKWNGAARTTAFVNAAQLTAAILATDIASAGSYPVTVTSATGTSNAVTFTVTAPPGVTALSPSYTVALGPAFTLTVTGSNFVSGDAVWWNGKARTTTFVTAAQLNAAIPQTDLVAGGAFPITVVRANGAASKPMLFTVTHPPLAYGFFNGNATPGSTSGNITCKWSAPEYLCTIAGEPFYFSKYVVNVTIGDINIPAMVTVNSISNQMIVKIYNPSGTAIQAPFNIVVFKP